MPDERHRRATQDLKPEDNTEAFRREARRALELNDEWNQLQGLKRGGRGYKISSHAELADALVELGHETVTRKTVQNILGAVDEEREVETVERSGYIPVIRHLLEMEIVETITVKAQRVDVLQVINEMPEDEFRIFAEAAKKRRQNTK